MLTIYSEHYFGIMYKDCYGTDFLMSASAI